MKTLHVIDSLGAGGAERSLVETLVRVRDRGIDPVIVCFHQRQQGSEAAARRADIAVHVIDGHTRRGRIRPLQRLVESVDPDLVHTTLYEADVLGRLAIRRKRPLLTSLVNTSYESERLDDSNVSTTRLRAAQVTDAVTARLFTTHFHAISEAVKTAAMRDLRLPGERISVVPRGRDPQRLGVPSLDRRHRVRRQLGIDLSTPVIINVGRREHQKGQDFLLDAAALLRRSRPNAIWLVAGRDGSASKELNRMHDRLELGEAVRFLGHRDDVPDLLAAADVFVFPSRFEGLGGSVLEAMALGVPVVASNIPAMREVLAEGTAGRLVPPRDPRALAEQVSELLEDRGSAQQLAAQGQLRFEQTYRLEQSVEAMAQLFVRVASGGLSHF